MARAQQARPGDDGLEQRHVPRAPVPLLTHRDRAPIVPLLALFAILLTPAEALLAPAVNAWSRKNEYEADRFAAQTTAAPGELVGALRRLSVQNLANLTPHPWHVLLHYSHPPLLQRIAAIRAMRG